MYALLLTIIYIAFISLGLPDSLLGSAWPVMREDFGEPVSAAGIIAITITVGTIVSSLLSDKLTRRLGAGLVTAVSVLMTACALAGFAVSGEFWQLCLWAVPYGVGAGAVDAALNNFVALHYASRHMNWLHCFWGAGAAAGPYIMSHFITSGRGWSWGYGAISIIQIVLTAVLFLSLPLWKKQKTIVPARENRRGPAKAMLELFHIKGVKYALAAFFSYCALETTAGLWAATYLVSQRGESAGSAAMFASLFYLGITAGRFLSGFAANRLGDRNMIGLGTGLIFMGVAALMFPYPTDAPCLAGLVIIGLGCAPIYPCIIHSTPANFGAENSQAVVGLQMAAAYTGAAFMPPLFGVLAGSAGMRIYPAYLLFFAVLMLSMTAGLNRSVTLGKPR